MTLRIISGGQAGVDRAALDVAVELGIPHGGRCPRGRRAEDGPIPECYDLIETRSASYAVRTEQNVVDSDGTLILYRSVLQGGTALTRDLASRHKRPLFLVDLERPVFPGVVRGWIEAEAIRVLNVAGPRESQAPGIWEEAGAFLREVLNS
jgi:hypothetical protein